MELFFLDYIFVAIKCSILCEFTKLFNCEKTIVFIEIIETIIE